MDRDDEDGEDGKVVVTITVPPPPTANNANNIPDNTCDNTHNNHGSTHDNTHGNTHGHTYGNTHGNTRDKTHGNTHDNTHGNTHDKTRDNTHGNTRDNTQDNTQDKNNVNNVNEDDTVGNKTLNRRRAGKKPSQSSHASLLLDPIQSQFVRSIRRKDVSGVDESLRANPDIKLHRLEDLYGVSTIEHAVVAGCWQIVQRLLDKAGSPEERAQAIERAMLFAIRENNTDIVQKLIDLHKASNMCRGLGQPAPILITNSGPGPQVRVNDVHVTGCDDQNDQYWEDAEYSKDINPMVLAAQLERVEIIEMLYKTCCPMIHPLTADKSQCLYPEKCYICHVHISTVGLQSIEECRAAVQVYRALSSPAYMFHAGVEDPILEAFTISEFLEERKTMDPAYREEYERIAASCRQFATVLLGLCRSTSEVYILLREEKGIDRTHRTQFHDIRFPRLLLAINYNQKEFVSHPNTQQVMQNVWYKGLPIWVCQKHGHHVRLALYCLLMLLLMPITMSLYMFRVVWVEQFVKPPVNKLILDLCSFIYFLIMIFIKVSFNIRPERGDKLSALDIFIFIWVIGLTVKFFVISSRRKDRWWTYAINAENSDWRFHELLSLVFFWIYYLIMIVLWAVKLAQHLRITPREELHTWDAYLVAEAAFAVASILTVIQVYSFFKVSSVLGPLQVSLKKMVFDVAKFMLLFLVVLSAFSVGLAYLYTAYGDYKIVDKESNETMEEQGDYFIGLERSYKTLFWNIFGYGDPEDANMVMGEYMKNETTGEMSSHSHRFNELTGYAIYGIYHITVVIVLLNMLIAMMANSYNNIEANADMEWKFARTRLIMNYVDEAGVLCAPFNVFPVRRLLAVLGTKIKRCGIFKKREPEKEVRDSKALMERLQKRYWKARKRKENNASTDAAFSGDVGDTTSTYKTASTATIQSAVPQLRPIGEEDVKLNIRQRVSGITATDSGI